MSINRGNPEMVDPVLREGQAPSAKRLAQNDRMVRGIFGEGGTRVSYRNGKIGISGGGGADFSQFCFGFKISGTTVTIIGGDWPIGEPLPLELADTDVQISQDGQYVGLEVDTINKTIKVIGPSTSKAFFAPDAKVFRTWLHRFHFSGGTASFYAPTHLGSLFMPSTFGAVP